MKWIEFAVYTTDPGLDLVCGALSKAGIDQVLLEESPERVEQQLAQAAVCWDFADFAALSGSRGPCVKAYLPDPDGRAALILARKAVDELKEMDWAFDIGPLQMVETMVDDEDWANAWKRYYKPIEIGKRLLICPSWEEASLTGEQLRGRALVRLDPGMVFGTGAHHTTRMCLELIEEYAQAGMSVLDIGSGSGILAIAALALSADRAVCVDIDPVAARVIGENMRMNSCGAYRAETGDILADAKLRERVAGGYDLVMANIVASVVIALCPFIPQYLNAGGRFLCSGIIEERAEEVEEALLGAGFVIREKRRASDSEDSAWLAYLVELG